MSSPSRAALPTDPWPQHNRPLRICFCLYPDTYIFYPGRPGQRNVHRAAPVRQQHERADNDGHQAGHGHGAEPERQFHRRPDRDVQHLLRTGHGSNNLACWLNHTWDFGDGTAPVSGENLSSVSHCYTVAQPAVITHTLASCTPFTSSQNVDPTFSGPSTLDAGFTYGPPGPSCGPVPVTFTANGNGGFPVSHVWKILDNNNIIFTSTAPSFTFVFSTTGSYTVEHTVSEAGCGTTATTSQTVAIQTSVAIFGNGPGGPPITAASLPVGYTAIQINGVLTISGTYTFPANSTVIMREGSEIRLTPGAKLNASGVTFKGCDRMWRGIYAVNTNTSGSQSDVHMGGCTIMDAEFGVWAEGKTNVYFSGCKFHKNHIAVRVPYLYKFMGLYFLGNIVDGAGTFLPKYLLPFSQPNGNFAQAGLWLENFSGSVGGGLSTDFTNHFTNMRRGIVALNMLLKVSNSTFGNIQGTQLPDGSAIYAGSGTVLTQTGLSGIDPDMITFNACDHGIFVWSSSLDGCSLNRMEKVGRGVYALLCSGKTINVFDNEIECTKSGVRVALSGVPKDVRIAKNRIVLNATSTDGMSYCGVCLEESSVHTGPYRVFYNHITVNKGNSGIRSKFLSTEVTLDTVVLADNTIPKGINLFNAHQSRVACNEVVGAGITSNNATNALYTESSHTVRYTCNYLDNSRTGARFDGACGSSIFSTTSFNRHYNGLYMGSDGVVGLQPNINDPNDVLHRGNVWDNSVYVGNGGNGATYDPLNLPNIIYSKFLVNTSNNPNRMPYPPPPGDWFKDVSGDTKPLCEFQINFQFASDCDTGMVALTNDHTDLLDEAIAKGEFRVNELTEWMAQRYLYERLMRQPNLVVSGSDFENFKDLEESTSVGGLSTVQSGISAMFTLDTATVAYRESITSAIHNSLSKLGLIAEQWVPGISANDSLTFFHQREAELQYLFDLAGQLAALEAETSEERSSDAELVISENATVPTTRIFDENRRTVNDIFLRTVAKGIYTLTDVQISELEAIAVQCPSEGGEAVYAARVLLLLNDPDVEDDYLYDCGQANPLILPPGEKVETVALMDIGIQPNPARTKVRVVFPNVSEGEYSLQFYNSIGQPVIVKTIEESTNIDISFLPDGIYIVSLKGKEGQYTAKLVVKR